MKREIVIAGLALLSVVALAGWTRKPVASPATVTAGACEQPASAYPATPVNYAQPYGQPVAGYAHAMSPVSYGTAPVVYVPAQPAAPEWQYARTAPVRRAVVTRSYQPVRTVQVRRGRPLSHSVAIVAGSSGMGAAIGALAGGGRGAAIGALTGGAGGFLYDRLTHNR